MPTAARAAQAGDTGLTDATEPTAVQDPDDDTCVGHIQRGAPESGVPGVQVLYQFACDGPITGYTLEIEPHQLEYFDQAATVALHGAPVVGDGVSCNGFVPGVQVNCVGQASQAYEVVSGQLSVAGGPICTEPRIDPILTVTAASASVTIDQSQTPPTAGVEYAQYIAGPFDLGRPWHCPGDRYGTDARLGPNPPRVVLPGRPKKT